MEEPTLRYEKIDFLGEGQFATVYKARDVKTDKIVAVKKIKIGSRLEAQDGINRTALREIKLLQELQHINLIGLLDVFGQKSNVSLVFDFMDTDLEIIIKDNNIVLTPANVKAYMIMTLKGLEYLHLNWILHRDLKPNNLLINREGILKIGDFGLAKAFGSPTRINTHQVVTRWYRSPELLFGARQYGTGVDMWAIGCILAELLLRVPFLPGESDLDQLSRIFQVFGTPGEETWPGMKGLTDYVQFKQFPPQQLRHIFSAAGDDLIQLMESLLALYPPNRCDCTQALQMAYFRRVYPVGEQYASLFQQPSGSLYTGTASSRARGDCTRIQREEFQQTKAKAEALKKPSQSKSTKETEKKAGEEGSTTTTSVTASTATAVDKAAKAKARLEKEQKRKEKEKEEKDKKLSGKTSLVSASQAAPVENIKPPYVLCSFEPDPIVEKEERERVNLLAQRDFLIRSYGMLEQIYLVMKKMGTLRPEDERKYGVYGRLSVLSNSPKVTKKV